jgi:hypothetical protein
MAPAGTPPAIVNRLNQAINADLQKPELRVRLQADAFSGPILSPERYGEFMRKQGTRARLFVRAVPPQSTCCARSSSTCFASRARRSSRIAAVSAPRRALGR